MKNMIAKSLSAALPLVLSAADLALSQDTDPATQFFRANCVLDLSEINVPEAVLQANLAENNGSTLIPTWDTRKLCTGSLASENIKLECSVIVPAWQAGLSVVDDDFTCRINGDQCQLQPPGFVEATSQMVTIEAATDADGNLVGAASMTCFFKR